MAEVAALVHPTARLIGPVFEPMRQDRDAFRSVRIDPHAGTIVWPNGADIDPDLLKVED